MATRANKLSDHGRVFHARAQPRRNTMHGVDLPFLIDVEKSDLRQPVFYTSQAQQESRRDRRRIAKGSPGYQLDALARNHDALFAGDARFDFELLRYTVVGDIHALPARQ